MNKKNIMASVPLGKTVGIVDYGASNLLSIKNALDFIGAQTIRVRTPEDFERAERFILPGVGSFSSGMEELTARGLVDSIKSIAQDGKPLLGICLGMQLLATNGTEGGWTQGLGLIAGEIVRLDTEQRVPHVGWNSVSRVRNTELTKGIKSLTDFYFLHSYRFKCDEEEIMSDSCSYGETFPAIIQEGKVYGVQFHPEKSHHAGLALLQNFLDL